MVVTSQRHPDENIQGAQPHRWQFAFPQGPTKVPQNPRGEAARVPSPARERWVRPPPVCPGRVRSAPRLKAPRPGAIRGARRR